MGWSTKNWELLRIQELSSSDVAMLFQKQTLSGPLAIIPYTHHLQREVASLDDMANICLMTSVLPGQLMVVVGFSIALHISIQLQMYLDG